MNTLEQLNNYGNNTITYTDNRAYGVVFNKSIYSNLDSSTTLTDKTIVVAPTINIEEIIDPTNAQVEYEIELPTSDAILNWGTLPAGILSYKIGNRYILQYLSSVSDWEAVKDPTITVGDDFFGSFFFTIRIKYRTPNGQQIVRSIVGGELPQMYLPSAADIIPNGDRIRIVDANLIGFGSIVTIAEALEIVYFEAVLPGAFGATIEATKIPPKRTSAVLTTAVALSAEADKIRNASAFRSASFSLSCVPTEIKGINLSLQYTVQEKDTTILPTQSPVVFNDSYWAWGDPGNTGYNIPYYGAVNIYASSNGSLQRTITPPSQSINFGGNMAIQGSTLSISATQASSNDGAVYQYNASNGNAIRTLTPPTSSLAAFYGSDVDMSSDYTIVSSSGTADKNVYVYNNSDGSLEYTLSETNINLTTAAITDDYAICGAQDDNKAYVYSMSTGSRLFTLSNPNVQTADSDDAFGNAVEITKNFAIVGARLEEGPQGSPSDLDSGVVYVFDLDNSASLKYTILNPDEDGFGYTDQFGFKLKAEEHYLLIGSPFEDGGTAYADNFGKGAFYGFNLASGNMDDSIIGTTNYVGYGWGVGLTETKCIVTDQSIESGSNGIKARVYNLN